MSLNFQRTDKWASSRILQIEALLFLGIFELCIQGLPIKRYCESHRIERRRVHYLAACRLSLE